MAEGGQDPTPTIKDVRELSVIDKEMIPAERFEVWRQLNIDVEKIIDDIEMILLECFFVENCEMMFNFKGNVVDRNADIIVLGSDMSFF